MPSLPAWQLSSAQVHQRALKLENWPRQAPCAFEVLSLLAWASKDQLQRRRRW